MNTESDNAITHFPNESVFRQIGYLLWIKPNVWIKISFQIEAEFLIN